MFNFITGVTSNAKFVLDEQVIVLRKGDEKKGFRHILEKHYGTGCEGEITAMDILNLINIVKRGIRLANEGVSNQNLVVYYHAKGVARHKLVLLPKEDKSLIITTYSV